MCRLWLPLDHGKAGEEGGVEHGGAGLADLAAEPVDDLAVLDHVGGAPLAAVRWPVAAFVENTCPGRTRLPWTAAAIRPMLWTRGRRRR